MLKSVQNLSNEAVEKCLKMSQINAKSPTCDLSNFKDSANEQ